MNGRRRGAQEHGSARISGDVRVPEFPDGGSYGFAVAASELSMSPAARRHLLSRIYPYEVLSRTANEDGSGGVSKVG